MTAVDPAPAVDLPAGVEARQPPEARGLRRDGVRLLVSRVGAAPVHARFVDLPRFLDPGDLLVINTSATLPAAVDAQGDDGRSLRVHLSTPLPADLWLVEAREPAGAASTPFSGDLRGTTLHLPEGGTVDLLHRYPRSLRLWLAALQLPRPVGAYLARWGQPIRYSYVERDWPIDAYQTVYATEAGSAEMPSAGRPFSSEVITSLVAHGVGMAPLLLHTGVSSLEGEELPYPEPFSVPADTARQINEARAAGRRVVAVGTTVVRALESVVDSAGAVHPGGGWTDLVITPERGVTAIDGLLTGFHAPTASHLWMIAAVASRKVLEAAYAAAREHGYLRHEFGDSHLILRR